MSACFLYSPANRGCCQTCICAHLISWLGNQNPKAIFLELKKVYNVVTKDDSVVFGEIYTVHSLGAHTPIKASHHRSQDPHLLRIWLSDEWDDFHSCRAVEQTLTCQSNISFCILVKTTICYQVWELFYLPFSAY